MPVDSVPGELPGFPGFTLPPALTLTAALITLDPSSVAPFWTATELAVPSGPLTRSVPTLTAIGPGWELTPDKVSVPTPFFASPLPPANAAWNSASWPPVSMVAPPASIVNPRGKTRPSAAIRRVPPVNTGSSWVHLIASTLFAMNTFPDARRTLPFAQIAAVTGLAPVATAPRSVRSPVDWLIAKVRTISLPFPAT